MDEAGDGIDKDSSLLLGMTRLTQMKRYYVYIMASYSRVLYTGMTNDLCRRVYQHKNKLTKGFTSKYNVNQLVYYEETNDVRIAIEREKQIKDWKREKRVALIESMNAKWIDLSFELCGENVDSIDIDNS